jgi:hypothetical protein
MENIIKKIEQYEADHKVRYDAAMTKPFSEIVFEFAGIIGAYQSQLNTIKIELELINNQFKK